MRSILVGALLSASMWASPAHAGILAAGTIYGGPTQVTAVCYLFNAGTTGVVITSIAIYDEVGNAYPVVSNNCSGSLAMHRSCRTVAHIFDGIPYACRAVASITSNLRGNLELRDASGYVLNSQQLR